MGSMKVAKKNQKVAFQLRW